MARSVDWSDCKPNVKKYKSERLRKKKMRKTHVRKLRKNKVKIFKNRQKNNSWHVIINNNEHYALTYYKDKLLYILTDKDFKMGGYDSIEQCKHDMKYDYVWVENWRDE